MSWQAFTPGFDESDGETQHQRKTDSLHVQDPQRSPFVNGQLAEDEKQPERKKPAKNRKGRNKDEETRRRLEKLFPNDPNCGLNADRSLQILLSKTAVRKYAQLCGIAEQKGTLMTVVARVEAACSKFGSLLKALDFVMLG